MMKIFVVGVFCVIMLSLFVLSCGKKQTNLEVGMLQKDEQIVDASTHNLMSNAELEAHFEINRSDFEQLSQWIIEDKLEFLQLNGYDKRHLNRISKEKEEQYFHLMNKLNIQLLAYGNALQFNSVILYFSPISIDGSQLSQGYEYKKNSTKINKDWVLTDCELTDEINKQELNTFVYKPIDEHWSLVALKQ